jgi:aldose 1-epimerase
MADVVSRRAVLRAAGAAGVTAAAAAAVAGAGSAAAAAPAVGTVPSVKPTDLQISSEPFGTMPDGTPVRRYTFGAPHGLSVQMLTYGATIQALHTPDRHGRQGNVVLGLKTLDEYRTVSPYFGATIGRYANRIKGGRFSIDGHTYQIPPNDNGNALHGGPLGFDKKVWSAEEVRSPDSVGVRFGLVSPDGEMGFPGTLTATVTYTVDTSGELAIDYHATTDKPTIVNLTNHAYFNLAGEGEDTVYATAMQVDADQYTPIDTVSIPLGPQAAVAGTPFDFRHPTALGARIRDGVTQLVNAKGYDHNWVLTGYGAGMRTVARAYHPGTGRRLECRTDQPGVQLYTGNFLDASVKGTSGRMYRQGDAFTLETQHYPDSPNEPSYPSTVLRPGQVYRTRTVFAFRAG